MGCRTAYLLGCRTHRPEAPMSKGTSRLPGFYKMKMAERLRRMPEARKADEAVRDGLGRRFSLLRFNADTTRESAIGVRGLPLGLGLILLINGEGLLVPMAVEEPSVVAAASLAA